MTVVANTERLIKQVGLVFAIQIALTSTHHVYGGLVYKSAMRMSAPIVAGIELLIVLGLLFVYRQTQNGIALTLFSVMAVLVGIVQGIFHTFYGHIYKDLLFLVGVPANMVRNYFLPVIPNDFIYPPNDFFFEATGVLEVATIYLIALFTYRLIRDWQSRRQ